MFTSHRTDAPPDFADMAFDFSDASGVPEGESAFGGRVGVTVVVGRKRWKVHQPDQSVFRSLFSDRGVRWRKVYRGRIIVTPPKGDGPPGLAPGLFPPQLLIQQFPGFSKGFLLL